MAENSFITYTYNQVGAGGTSPAFIDNLNGRSFTLTAAQIADTTDMTINDVDGDSVFDDQNTTSGQTYDPNELMVSFDGNTGAPYAGADWNTYATYTVTGSDGSTFSVSLIARGDPTFDGRIALNADGSTGDGRTEYYYAFTQPLKEGVTYTYSNWNQAGQVPWASLVAPCFTTGTLINTDRGPIPVEDIGVGDRVVTRDNGLQEVRWIGSSKLDQRDLVMNEKIIPIRIRRNALGANVPSSDLLVSPQHRILVRSRIAQKMFGSDEVLIAAKQLCQIDGIDIADDVTEVEYFHLLFDQHEIVISNGAETESLYTGPEALKSLSPAALIEIFEIFPELKDHDYMPAGARILASGRMGRRLVFRHNQNSKMLVN